MAYDSINDAAKALFNSISTAAKKMKLPVWIGVYKFFPLLRRVTFGKMRGSGNNGNLTRSIVT